LQSSGKIILGVKKYIALLNNNDGKSLDFLMNDKCAAGL